MARTRDIELTTTWVPVADGPGAVDFWATNSGGKYRVTDASTGNAQPTSVHGKPIPVDMAMSAYMEAGERLWVRGRRSTYLLIDAEVEV